MGLTGLLDLFKRKTKVEIGEKVDIFVPYTMYLGSHRRGWGSGGLINSGNDFPMHSMWKDNYVKLKGYKGTFKVTKFFDGGYHGGDFVDLVREDTKEAIVTIKVFEERTSENGWKKRA